MNDRVVQYPSRYRLVKVAGTTDIYDLVPAPGDITEEGTYINKTTLLDDDTAAMLWSAAEMPEVPTPNLAFQRQMQLRNNPIGVAYGSDLWLFVTGQHPIVQASPFYDYDRIRFEQLYPQIAEDLARTISLTGEAQDITVYDGGGNL